MSPISPLASFLTPLFLAATPALAATPEVPEDLFLSEAGVEYVQVESLTDIVLQSRTPVTYHVRAAAAERSGVETITFDPKTCLAQSSLLGEGGWGWANGGFGANFLGPASVIFPRQELPGAPEACRW